MTEFTHTVFELLPAISGIDNNCIQYDDYQSTLFYRFESTDINECNEFIHDSLIDYKKRGILGKRFVILQVYT